VSSGKKEENDRTQKLYMKTTAGIIYIMKKTIKNYHMYKQNPRLCTVKKVLKIDL